MNTQTPISVDGQAGIFRYARGRVSGLMNNMKREICLLDAKVRTMNGAADEGAATAEYAVVLVAATGFATLLVALLKSDVTRTLLSNIVKKSLSV